MVFSLELTRERQISHPKRYLFKIIEQDGLRIPGRSRAEMTRKVFILYTLICSQMLELDPYHFFLKDYTGVKRIINYFRLFFVAKKSPPPHFVSKQLSMDLKALINYFSLPSF